MTVGFVPGPGTNPTITLHVRAPDVLERHPGG
jgi:hypothetical protein